VRTAVVYVLVLVLLRAAGKRELGQMSPVDLVVILVIANAVQNAMTGGDNSLIGGVIAATTLVTMNVAFSRVAHRIPYVAHLFESEAAREHGIEDLAGVESAYLERDGSISIIPKGAPGKSGSRRHIRQFRQR